MVTLFTALTSTCQRQGTRTRWFYFVQYFEVIENKDYADDAFQCIKIIWAHAEQVENVRTINNGEKTVRLDSGRWYDLTSLA